MTVLIDFDSSPNFRSLLWTVRIEINSANPLHYMVFFQSGSYCNHLIFPYKFAIVRNRTICLPEGLNPFFLSSPQHRSQPKNNYRPSCIDLVKFTFPTATLLQICRWPVDLRHIVGHKKTIHRNSMAPREGGNLQNEIWGKRWLSDICAITACLSGHVP